MALVSLVGPSQLGCSSDGVPTPSNALPRMLALPHTTYTVGMSQDVTLRSEDSDDFDELSFEIEGATVANLVSRSQLIPQGGRDGVGSAIFRWSPMQADIGVHEIKFRVRDPHGGSAATRLRLTVVER